MIGKVEMQAFYLGSHPAEKIQFSFKHSQMISRTESGFTDI